MATKKQIEANRENAKKGGVKSVKGKAITRWNALEHGLLAREVVIDSGDGKEDRSYFDSLLADLQTRLQPDGVLEAMLVEKIAVSFWRYRRAVRYETGLLRSHLDHFVEEYYDPLKHLREMDWKSHRNIQEELNEIQAYLGYLQDDNDTHDEHVDPEKASEDVWDTNLEESYKALIYSEDVHWQDCFMRAKEYDLQTICHWLLTNGWTKHKIKARFILDVQAKLKDKKAELEKVSAMDQLRLDQMAKERALPISDQTDVFIRYETAILRQFYRAMHELERLQSGRRGIAVSPPVTIDVEGASSEA